MVDPARDLGQNPLAGRTLYIPGMCRGSATIFSGAFRALGINAATFPEGDARTRELAARHCTGDECYPQIVTMGNFLKIAEQPGFDPSATALMMPTAGGPCRFGQYAYLFRRMMREVGLDEVAVVSPTCEDGYRSLGAHGEEIIRYGWWALVAGDQLRKMLHRTRPYERKEGTTDALYWECVEDATETLSNTDHRHKEKFADLLACMKRCRERFRGIDADYSKKRLLIGVAGEIYCRLNTFSNEDMVRKIEQHGGEAWVSDIAEWVLYVNQWEMEEFRVHGKRLSKEMLVAKLSDKVQRKEEHQIAHFFEDHLVGWEEPQDLWADVLNKAEPYIPPHAALGEMVLNIGKSVYMHGKGVDGVVDISPFSCMNGIVSEAIYPKMTRDLDGMPIRAFYFDGTTTDLDNDVSIFMELAAHYSRKKKKTRKWPECFG